MSKRVVKSLGIKMGGGKDANKPKTLGRFKMGGPSKGKKHGKRTGKSKPGSNSGKSGSSK